MSSPPEPPRAPDEARARLASLAAAVAVTGAAAYALRGFAVDDAWIAPRYATHLAAGLGHTFSRGAPASDGVTPLGFAWLLAAFRPASVMASFEHARALSLLATLVGAALLGLRVAREGRAALVSLVALGAAPVGAWAVAGLETGLAFLSASVAVTGPPALAVVGAGALGLLRPEAIPLALVLTLVRAREGHRSRRGAVALGLVTPAILGAGLIVRRALFDAWVPLSFYAKAPSLTHGTIYVLAGAILTPGLWLALGRPRSLLALAVPTHLVAVAWAGGDWMPLSRLLVPLVPVLVVLAAEFAGRASRLATGLRLAVALAALGFQWVRGGIPAQRILPTRLGLVRAARGVLSDRDVVAALDVGWLGAATEARIVDLAGLTDRGIARLPGGHTTKRVTWAMLADRGVTHLVLLRSPRDATEHRSDGGPFSRGVEEALLTHEPYLREHTTIQAILRAGTLEYVVLRIIPDRS